jgi:hypothetical protein
MRKVPLAVSYALAMMAFDANAQSHQSISNTPTQKPKHVYPTQPMPYTQIDPSSFNECGNRKQRRSKRRKGK